MQITFGYIYQQLNNIKYSGSHLGKVQGVQGASPCVGVLPPHPTYANEICYNSALLILGMKRVLDAWNFVPNHPAFQQHQ
jgi:hypothetical protein